MNISVCPCCDSTAFERGAVLWPELIEEWSLSAHESEFIDRQQGLRCCTCHANLRSMTLAKAILDICDFDGSLAQFIATEPALKVLEVNEAGNLSELLARLPNHQLVSYPAVDLADLPFENESFDLVVHSDTLEHFREPIKGLEETLRVLRPGGDMLDGARRRRTNEQSARHDTELSRHPRDR